MFVYDFQTWILCFVGGNQRRDLDTRLALDNAGLYCQTWRSANELTLFGRFFRIEPRFLTSESARLGYCNLLHFEQAAS